MGQIVKYEQNQKKPLLGKSRRWDEGVRSQDAKVWEQMKGNSIGDWRDPR